MHSPNSILNDLAKAASTLRGIYNAREVFLDALASLRPHRPRIAIDNLRIQTWILRLSPDSFWIAKITTESISENWDCVNIISNVKCQ